MGQHFLFHHSSVHLCLVDLVDHTVFLFSVILCNKSVIYTATTKLKTLSVCLQNVLTVGLHGTSLTSAAVSSSLTIVHPDQEFQQPLICIWIWTVQVPPKLDCFITCNPHPEVWCMGEDVSTQVDACCTHRESTLLLAINLGLLSPGFFLLEVPPLLMTRCRIKDHFQEYFFSVIKFSNYIFFL